VKKSGKDEPIRIVVHMCMDAMLGISLYNHLYLKLAKMLCLSYLLCFLFNKNWRKGQNRLCLEARGVGGEREGVGEQRGEMA
jgi:hypothetical protein